MAVSNKMHLYMRYYIKLVKLGLNCWVKCFPAFFCAWYYLYNDYKTGILWNVRVLIYSDVCLILFSCIPGLEDAVYEQGFWLAMVYSSLRCWIYYSICRLYQISEFRFTRHIRIYIKYIFFEMKGGALLQIRTYAKSL